MMDYLTRDSVVNKMKNINIVISSMDIGGAEKVLTTFLNNFDRRQYKVSLTLYRRKGNLLADVPSDVEIRQIVLNGDGYFAKMYRFFFRILLMKFPKMLSQIFRKKYSNNVVHIAFLEGLPTRIVSLMPGDRIAWVHTDIINNPASDKWFNSLEEEREIYGKFRQVVLVSQSAKFAFETKLAPISVPINVLHNPIDSDFIQKMALEKNRNFFEWDETTKNSKRLIVVGRIEKVKHVDLLIRAMAYIPKDISLTIVGDGTEKENLEKLCKNLHITNILFLGHIENPYPYLANADLYVNSSFVEAYPTAIAEALVLGLPVLASKNGGSEEILGDSEYGMIFPSNISAKNLADTLLSMLNQVDLWKQRANIGARTLDIKKVMNQYSTVIDNKE